MSMITDESEGRLPASRPGGTPLDRAMPPRPAHQGLLPERSGRAEVARLAREVVTELGFDPRKVLARLVSRALPPFAYNRTRTALLRAIGVRIGAGSRIMGPLDITGCAGDPVDQLSIGEHTHVSGPLHVDLGAPVRIGSRVTIGHHVVLFTVDHEIGPSEARCGRGVVAPIVIEDGAWVASRVTVLPGITIGAGAVVATGAVVTQDVPPDTVVGGVPAQVLRHLPGDSAPATMSSRLSRMGSLRPQ
jgi:acetyltransferase-like isoleucine patch superfamily enzyme